MAVDSIRRGDGIRRSFHQSLTSGLTLLIGDAPADILYVPDTVPSGKAVPLSLKLGSATSQAGVTLSVM